MKRLITTTLSMAVLTLSTSAVLAQQIYRFGPNSRPKQSNELEQVQLEPQVTSLRSFPSSTMGEEIRPVTLVQLAYQGYFEDQGIPSAGRFLTEVNSGDIDANTLVRTAISRGRLSADAINDQGYLNIVEIQLESLDDG